MAFVMLKFPLGTKTPNEQILEYLYLYFLAWGLFTVAFGFGILSRRRTPKDAESRKGAQLSG